MDLYRFLLPPLAVATTILAPAGELHVGDTPEYSWVAPPVGCLGRTRLQDLRGTPVLIEFWGIHMLPGIESSVPIALELQAQYGEDLQVLFVESQDSTDIEAERFALDQGWLGGRAMWTSERPLDTGLPSLPSSVLLSAEGEVLVVGMNWAIHNKVVDALQALSKDKNRLPPEAPRRLKKPWIAFKHGKLAKALEELRAIAGKPGELGDAAVAMTQRIEASLDSRLSGAAWLLDHGYPNEAQQELDQLTDDVAGLEHASKRCDELRARLEADAFGAEFEASKALAKLEKTLFKSGASPKLAKRFTKLAAEYPGTHVAERATHDAELIE